MYLTDEEVLALPGIVVRKLPHTVVSRWRRYVQHHGEPRNTETLTLVEGPDEKGGYLMEERRPVSPELAGKYLVTVVHGTGSTVCFSRANDGVGDTIAEAYHNIKTRVLV